MAGPKTRTYENYWRGTARNFMFGPINGYAAFPIALFLFSVNWPSFFLLIVFLFSSIVIERYGYSVPVAILTVRSFLAGRKVPRVRMAGKKRLWT